MKAHQIGFVALGVLLLSLQVFTFISMKSAIIEVRAVIEMQNDTYSKHNKLAQESWDWLRNFVNVHTATEEANGSKP